MSEDFDSTQHREPDIKELLIRKDALINSLQIKYYLKNIHKQNLKYKLINNGEFDNRIFYNLSFMIVQIENELNVNLDDQCVNVPRNWKEIIDFRCSIAKIKSFLNKSKKNVHDR